MFICFMSTCFIHISLLKYNENKKIFEFKLKVPVISKQFTLYHFSRKLCLPVET